LSFLRHLHEEIGVPDVPEPSEADRVDDAFTIRVADSNAAYDDLRTRGAEFLTPPFAMGSETRCFFRDPDGHLFEISSIG
jgi:catechol 2,3-dioxygenase-like lactoylglutathione lyase family enzyme